MDNLNFPTAYTDILDRIDRIDPYEYARTKNFLNGAVTYLSPYISRGVISVKQVFDHLQRKGYKLADMEKLVQELAWREYFQRVWQYYEDDIFEDIRHRHTGTRHRLMPDAISKANTGITAIDTAIKELYANGYMHNHLRMYIASITCNIGKAWWQTPAQWMYYHLLDGDLASNACSWQWVAGTFSSKQYFCNQENINRYTGTSQNGSFLDHSYNELPQMEVPEVLQAVSPFTLTTTLPEITGPQLDHSLPLLLYSPYHLDPLWKKDMKANRVLLLEPSHYKQFPVSEKVIRFIMDLGKNIPGLQVMVGEASAIPGLRNFPAIYTKEHPAFRHWPGIKEERDWLFPDVKGMFYSFFGFWKRAEASLRKKEVKDYELKRA